MSATPDPAAPDPGPGDSDPPPRAPAPPSRRRRELAEWFPHDFSPRSYPYTGPWAVAARVVFLAATLAVALAALGPHQFKPRMVGHYHLQRFAAWYVLSGLAAAAMPRMRLRWLGLALIVFAFGSEVLRALPHPFQAKFKDNLYSDIGGIYALMFPLALARWREAVKPRPGGRKA
jgi:hypothetical protein